jgi:flavodoxin
MKSFIFYDSLYGNTEKIAQAIGRGLPGDVDIQCVSQGETVGLALYDLVVVGSPVHGGRPTPEIEAFVRGLPAGALTGKRVAAFDTRFEVHTQGVGLRLLMYVIRYAAPRIARDLLKKGGELAAEPEGFIVEQKEGPLKQGELERAVAWATTLVGENRPAVSAVSSARQ